DWLAAIGKVLEHRRHGLRLHRIDEKGQRRAQHLAILGPHLTLPPEPGEKRVCLDTRRIRTGERSVPALPSNENRREGYGGQVALVPLQPHRHAIVRIETSEDNDISCRARGVGWISGNECRCTGSRG